MPPTHGPRRRPWDGPASGAKTGRAGFGQRGFTYLLLLFVIAIGGAGLAAVGEREQTLVQREREAELRFRGEAIARAIQRYVETGPVGRPVLPARLDDLLEDRRSPLVQHPLRQLYIDPFTGKADWEMLYGVAPVKTAEAADANEGSAQSTSSSSSPLLRGIVGVRSRSTRQLFNLQWAQLVGRRSSVKASDLLFLAAGQTPEADSAPR